MKNVFKIIFSNDWKHKLWISVVALDSFKVRLADYNLFHMKNINGKN